MQRLIKICLDAVLREHERRFAREHIAHLARIIGDRNAALQPIFKCADVLRKPLRCTPNHMHVHAVRARTNNAAQPCRSERKFRIEPFFDLLFIPCYRSKFFAQRGIQLFFFHPLPIGQFRLLHKTLPFLSAN